jgi:hypothetical protein
MRRRAAFGFGLLLALGGCTERSSASRRPPDGTSLPSSAALHGGESWTWNAPVDAVLADVSPRIPEATAAPPDGPPEAETAVADTGPDVPEAGASTLDEVVAGVRAENGCPNEERCGTDVVAERDLDGDGTAEVLMRLGWEDGSTWYLIHRGPGGWRVIATDPVGNSEARFLDLAGGPPVLVSEHDCCCAYRLDVAALRAGETELKPLYRFDSSCGEGCEDGYQARLVVQRGRLESIREPRRCGAEAARIVRGADLAARAREP